MQNLIEIQIRAQGCDCVAPYIETVLSAPTFVSRTEIVDCRYPNQHVLVAAL